MNAIRCMSIGSRLILAFGMLLLTLILVAAFALHQMTQQKNITATIVEDQSSRVALANELKTDAQAAALPLLQLLVTGERDARIPLYKNMDEINAAAAKALENLRKASPDGGNKEALDQISALSSAYRHAFQDTVEQIELDGPASAHQHFLSHTQPALKALLAAVDTLLAKEQQAMKDGQHALVQSEANARLMVISMTVAAMVLSVLLAWVVTRSITLPLSEAVAFASRVATGDLDHQLHVQGKDETAVLARALITMQSALSKLIGSIHASAHSMRQAAEQMSLPVEHVQASSKAQHEAVAQVTRTTASFAHEAKDIALTAGSSRQQAEAARDLASQGCELINTASNEVTGIAATISKSANAVDTLRERAISVRALLTTVKEIADQTNLLALNAAIEAARAGEAGRGFAIVADEVRKLADRTSKATTEIDDVIDAIDKQTSVAIQQIDLGQQEMRRGVELIEGMVQPLNQLREGAEQSLGRLDQLATTLSRQMQDSSTIAQSIAEVGNMASDNLQATAAVARTSQSLDNLSAELTRELQRFRLAR